MENIVKHLGLSEKQSQTYLVLLESGTCSMSELAKRTGLKRPTCYLLINDLVTLGLVNEQKNGKRKVYSAVHPRRLLELVKHRERAIEEVFPQLLALHNSPKDKPKIHVFEYNYDKGVKQLYGDIYKSLQQGSEVLFFTNFAAFKNFPQYVKLYKKTLKELADIKIRELIFGENAEEYWQKEIKQHQGKRHFTRLLPPNLKHGETDMMILNNQIGICSLKKNIFITIIESQDIADSQRALFECAWQISKEI